MADFNTIPEMQDITRQREMAKLLLTQGMQSPQGQMIGNRYVGAHPLQFLGNLAQTWAGKSMIEESDKKQAELADMLRRQTMQDIQEYGRAVKGTPEQTTYGAGEEGPTMSVTPAVAPDYDKGLAILMGSKSPTSQALAQALIQDQLKTLILPEGATAIRGTLGGTTGQTIQGAPKEPTEYREYLKAKEGGFQGSFFDYQQALKKAGATNVTVSTEKSYGSAFGQGLAKTDLDLYTQAQKAPEMLSNVQSTKKLLDSGKVYTGFGAGAKLDLARAGSALGVTGKDTNEIIANTQQLFANRAQTTLDAISSSGLGSGQGFSNKDREFLEAARLGNITYDKETLKRQLDLEERVARASANKWNTRLKSIPRSATEPTGVNEVLLPAQGEINTGSTSSGRFPSQSEIDAEIARRQKRP